MMRNAPLFLAVLAMCCAASRAALSGFTVATARVVAIDGARHLEQSVPRRSARAQGGEQDPWSEVRAALAARVASGEAPSLAVGVLRRGEVVWRHAVGHADRERGVPATSSTRYPVGSLSKSISATAALTLVERGLVQLEDPLADWLGDAAKERLGDVAQRITLHDALAMRAGIAPGSVGIAAGREAWGLPEQLQRCLVVAFEPGTEFLYSNYALLVAEAAVESATGIPFADYVEQAVFEPLGMERSTVGPAGRTAAASYDRDGQRVTPRQFLPASAGGMYSTVDDLLRYAAFHLGPRDGGQEERREGGEPILSAALLRRMHRAVSEAPPYALGWGAGSMGLVTNGNIRGACANLTLVPEADVAVCCLANATGSPGLSVADRVVIEVLDQLIEGYAARAREHMASRGQGEGAAPRLDGAWTGRIAGSSWGHACRLEVQATGSARLELDGRSAELSLRPGRPGFVGGTARIDLGLPGASGVADVLLRLRLADGALTGYGEARLVADGDYFAVPLSVRLTR